MESIEHNSRGEGGVEGLERERQELEQTLEEIKGDIEEFARMYADDGRAEHKAMLDSAVAEAKGVYGRILDITVEVMVIKKSQRDLPFYG